jgi:hypothetical protein
MPLDNTAHSSVVIRASKVSRMKRRPRLSLFSYWNYLISQSANAVNALSVGCGRFVHHLAVDGGYSVGIVGLSCTAPSVAVCDSELLDGSVTVAHVSCSPSRVARLALCERDQTRGAVDGAWWPKSLDLSSELPDLVAVFGSWIGRVHRVVYDPSVWLPAPARVIRRNEMVSLDPYRLVFSDTIYLMGTHSRDAVLFVLSPSSPGEEARRVLCEVSGSAQPMNAEVLRQLVRQCASGSVRSEDSAP